MLKALPSESREVGSRLEDFVSSARERGLSYETIRHLLLANGWKDKEIAKSLGEALELPIPAAHRKGGAREAFYHLSAFTCLYVSTISLIVMLFNLLDTAWPDPTFEYWSAEWAYTTIRSALSTMIVFFPLYLFFHWRINKETSNGLIVLGGTVERWLTYLTLFVVVMTILIDASILVFALLEGEMTARLLVKSLILIGVVGGAYLYLWMGTYRWSTKIDSSKAS